MGDWSWRLTAKARSDFEALEPVDRERIGGKLEEICTSPWRTPPDYGEPLQDSPYRKIRIGQFRLSASFDRDDKRLTIHRIKTRSGAYTADD